VVRWLIDYDSTLADTFAEQLVWLNRAFDSEYQYDSFTRWRSEDIVTAEEAAFLWGDKCFLNEDFQRECPPIPGAIDGMLELLDRGEHLMIVSDRPAQLFDVTRQWLDAQGLDMVRLLFTHHKSSMSLDSTGMMTKYQAAARYRLPNIIEDAPHHAEKFATMGWVDRIFLLDKPYNQGIAHPKIYRVYDWPEIISMVTVGGMVNA
jgi:uncharacterized HAD superfamily protein